MCSCRSGKHRVLDRGELPTHAHVCRRTRAHSRNRRLDRVRLSLSLHRLALQSAGVPLSATRSHRTRACLSLRRQSRRMVESEDADVCACGERIFKCEACALACNDGINLFFEATADRPTLMSKMVRAHSLSAIAWSCDSMRHVGYARFRPKAGGHYSPLVVSIAAIQGNQKSRPA